MSLWNSPCIRVQTFHRTNNQPCNIVTKRHQQATSHNIIASDILQGIRHLLRLLPPYSMSCSSHDMMTCNKEERCPKQAQKTLHKGRLQSTSTTTTTFRLHYFMIKNQLCRALAPCILITAVIRARLQCPSLLQSPCPLYPDCC